MNDKPEIATILVQVALVITIVVLVADDWLIRGALAFIPAMLLAQRALGSAGNKVSDGLTGGPRDLLIREPIQKLEAILREFQPICRLMGVGGITPEEALRRTNHLEKDLTRLLDEVSPRNQDEVTPGTQGEVGLSASFFHDLLRTHQVERPGRR